MKKYNCLFFLFIFSLYFSQESKCPEVTVNKTTSAWILINHLIDKNRNNKTANKQDIDLYVCILKQLDQIGDKKATSFLAQGFLYGIPLNGGKNQNQAEHYFSKLLYETNYDNIFLSKKNLNTSILNLYIEKNENKMIEIFEKRAKKFDDEYSLKYLGEIYRYKKGKEKKSIESFQKSCELGEKESCNLFANYQKSPEDFFKVRHTPPPPPPSN